MDYEKKYKEVLERASFLIEKLESDHIKGFIYNIFPELVENEDERVRKELIDAVQGLWDNDALPTPLTTKRKNEWIAWLEKQGEQKSGFDIEIPFGAKDSELQEATYYIPKGFYAEIDDDKVVIKKGEQKPAWSEKDERNLKGIIDEIEANKNAAPDYDLATYDRFLSWLNSLRPQKPQDKSVSEAMNEPIDKIEPKFKVGDWVVLNNNENDSGLIATLHIVDSDEIQYIVEDIYGNSGCPRIEYLERHYHLWNIKDAKDGDVLVHNSCVFIFMGLKDGIVKAINEFFPNPVNFGYPDIDNDYHPAIKEQRDLLFKKMEEAGYKWDSENKTVIKIK